MEPMVRQSFSTKAERADSFFRERGTCNFFTLGVAKNGFIIAATSRMPKMIGKKYNRMPKMSDEPLSKELWSSIWLNVASAIKKIRKTYNTGSSIIPAVVVIHPARKYFE